MTEKLIIAIAFPIAEAQRKLIRQLSPTTPITALYREGAQIRDCTSCGMHLNVGPRVLASGARVYCLICAGDLATALGATSETVNITDLGNPESVPELHCMDCDRRYEDFPLDVVLPDDDWLAIHPEGPGGVLCAQCIVTRAAQLPAVTVVRAHLERR